MRDIKFRQKIKNPTRSDRPFHYWGFIDGVFNLPRSAAHAENESQQFTGLKDKNGVEIYEGDILLWSNGYKHTDKVEVVSFTNGCFVSKGLWETKTKIAVFESDGCTWRFQVIGNIYENPELLEQQS